MTDYEGKAIKVGDRIELHPGCDLWMRGARFGTVVAITSRKDKPCATVKMDHPSVRLDQYCFGENLRTIPGALVLP